MTYKTFSKIIKNKRISKKITQAQMASELGLTRSNYNKIENGNIEPSFEMLALICRLLELDLTEILEIKKPREEHIRLYD